MPTKEEPLVTLSGNRRLPKGKRGGIELLLVHAVEHLGKQVSHAKVAAASMHAAGRRTSWWRLVTSPPGAFLKQIAMKGAWRDGYAGWLVAGSTAAGALMKHMALLEMQHEAER